MARLNDDGFAPRAVAAFAHGQRACQSGETRRACPYPLPDAAENDPHAAALRQRWMDGYDHEDVLRNPFIVHD